VTQRSKEPSAEKAVPLLPNIKDTHAILVIALLVLLFFRDILLQKAFLWDDFLYFIYPIRNFAALSFAMGEIPLWNPYTFVGMPFMADIQSGLFYIPNMLMTLFVQHNLLNYYWVELLTIAHYVLMGVTMYYLAKDYGIPKAYALFSGLAYPLSGFMIAHAVHLVHICQMAWIPLILLLMRRTLLQRSFSYMILGGVALGHAALVGFPQMTLYIVFFLFLFFVVEFAASIKESGLWKSLPMAGLAGGFILISLGVMAVQFLPTLELVPTSLRSEIAYEKTSGGSIGWEQLITLILPNYFGQVRQQASTFWLQRPYWEYWETSFYLGLVPLLAAAAALPLVRKNRNVAFFAGVGLLGLLYAIGDNFVVHRFFYDNVPGFDKFRVPGRLALYFTFGASLLAGFGLQELFNRLTQSARQARKIIGVVFVGAVAAWLAAQAGLFQPSTGEYAAQIHEIASHASTTAAVLLLILGIVLLSLHKRVVSPMVALGLLAVFHFVDLNLYGFDYVNGAVNPQEYFNRPAQLVGAMKEEGQHEFFRINARQGSTMIMDRNQGMIDRVFMLEGFSALVLQRLYPPTQNWDKTCDLLNVKYRIQVDEQARTMGIRRATTYLPRAYIVYSAKVIPDENSLKSFMESAKFEPSRIAVFEEEPPFVDTAEVDSVPWKATITSYTLNSIALDVSTPQRGYLILSEMYYSGWNAYIDGSQQRIYRVNWNQRGIPIDAGSHRVEVRFEPASFTTGVWITLGTVGLSVLGFVYSIARKRRPHPQ